MGRSSAIVVATALVSAAALRVPLESRRAVLAGSCAAAFSVAPAFAKPSELADPSLSKEERLAAAKARQQAEITAALPINRLKAKRDQLATADALINGGQWTDLRDLIQETTGSSLSKLQTEQKWEQKSIRLATAKMRKLLFDVDKFAYSQQSFPGSEAFSGYCAEGVVPRDSKSGCKVKPAVDKAPLLAAVKGAVGAFDEIISLVDK